MDADRGIPRSPSAPHFVSGDGTAGTVYPRFPAHICCVPSHNHSHPQPVYVLAADGSQLYLLDTSKRPGNEEPPPYLPIRQDSALPLRTELAPPHTRIRAATVSGALRRSTSSGSVPISSIGVPCPARSGPASPLRLDETTPLLGHPTEVAATAPPQWRWREILCGWDDSSPGVRGYFAPMSDKSNWKAVGHLIAINLPLNLLVWPPLLVGTLAGTALLITLPIGAVVWWLTLILARWAAHTERRLQSRYHGAQFDPPRPIFRYAVEVRSPETGGEAVVYERRFWRCSWAMLSDHYSYSALSYFLLIKPIVVLFSTIVIVALFPLAAVLLPLLPIYLRAARVWGRYQARVASENV